MTDTHFEQAVSADRAAIKAANEINKQLEFYSGLPVLVLASAGSVARDVIPSVLTDKIGRNVTLGVMDERIGPPEQRNWEALRGFIERSTNAKKMPILQNVTPETSGEDFNDQLHAWKKKNPLGKIIIIAGIGEDGHTGGIMPYPEDPEAYDTLFETPGKWAVGYDAGEKSQYRFRVTVTNEFIRQADMVIAYAVKKTKDNAFTRMADAAGSLASTPARIYRMLFLQRKFRLFTDRPTQFKW